MFGDIFSMISVGRTIIDTTGSKWTTLDHIKEDYHLVLKYDDTFPCQTYVVKIDKKATEKYEEDIREKERKALTDKLKALDTHTCIICKQNKEYDEVDYRTPRGGLTGDDTQDPSKYDCSCKDCEEDYIKERNSSPRPFSDPQ